MAASFRCLLVVILQLQLVSRLCLSADQKAKDGISAPASAPAAPHEHGGAGKAAEAALFVFGDSYADTGNHDPHDTNLSLVTPWRPPYGKLWPGHPSGRYSDGRVFTDFYARYVGARQPIPYRVFNRTDKSGERHGHDRARGINFAFGGSGVFPTFGPQYPNVSTQIGQLARLLEKGAVSKKLVEASTALLVVAGNDYTAYEEAHPDLEGVEGFIVNVVAEIGAALQALRELGFQRLAATKLQPVGCLPSSTASDNYTSCIQSLNQLAALHNSLLAARVASLQASDSAASFSTLDLFTAFETVLSGPKDSLRPCCVGIGNATCGEVDGAGRPLYSLCSFPYQTLFWDFFHPTDAGWTAITKTLFASIT